jgi:CRISPR-associated endonuclease/helicase Cas3
LSGRFDRVSDQSNGEAEISDAKATYAHSKAGEPRETWHRLEDHLLGTAEKARDFAAAWGAGEWGYLAGLWHDLGKYAPAWQDFLRKAGEEANAETEDGELPTKRRRRGPPHSAVGSLHSREEIGTLSLPFQFTIAAHHGGLPDKTSLDARLASQEEHERQAEATRAAPEEILHRSERPSDWPAFLTASGRSEERHRRLETFVRMVFSALVDADFLDTEAFFEKKASAGESRTKLRQGWPMLLDYEPVLALHLGRLRSTALPGRVNDWRDRVLTWCREAAAGPQGVYSLTVPTGGGKTLSGLAFGLAHARRHALRRVVIALPFISIVDQTASTFRRIFGPAFGQGALLEHHSSIEPVHQTTENRLASENWDASLIVTTQVQLFESLFSNRPSACRKLHNLAGSVVILDEVQTLPVGLLAPILDQLQQLATNYRMTLLLMTATQPSLHRRDLGAFTFPGLDPQPREIVPAGSLPDLFGALKRVRVIWPVSKESVNWPDLARSLAEERQVLAVVHRRDDARDLWKALLETSGERPVHLSALMCPAHRQRALDEVRERLRADATCRVVSTQLIEAGVDVDFPVVYRAMAGLESLAQTAGRCNREGKLAMGSFHVFNAPSEPPPLLREHRNIAAVMLETNPQLDLGEPAIFGAYFDRLYASHSLDVRAVQAARQALKYQETADKFRLIDDATMPIAIPYGPEGTAAIDALRYGGPSRETFRGIQRYLVGVYPQTANRMAAAGATELLHGTVSVLTSEADYDPDLGLKVEPNLDPLVV